MKILQIDFKKMELIASISGGLIAMIVNCGWKHCKDVQIYIQT